MLLLVGLGNPGAKYAGNRHNIGFMAVDALARAYRLAVQSLFILALPLILLGARYLPELLAARQRGDGEEAARVLREYRGSVVLCLAQGLGVGRAPVAPGTVGSGLGVLWFLLLVGTGDLWIYLAGLALGLAVSVPVCGAAERLLGRTDPPSVVFDEIVVVPLCFLPWVLSAWRKLEGAVGDQHVHARLHVLRQVGVVGLHDLRAALHLACGHQIGRAHV